MAGYIFHIMEHDASDCDYDDDGYRITNMDTIDIMIDEDLWDAAVADETNSIHWCSYYVKHIIADIKIDIANNGANKPIHTSTSRKYSFGDTPDWWDSVKATDITGKTIVEVYVDVVY